MPDYLNEQFLLRALEGVRKGQPLPEREYHTLRAAILNGDTTYAVNVIQAAGWSLVSAPCTSCGKPYLLCVRQADLDRYQQPNRPGVEELFPYLSNPDRELFISGTCPACWLELFPQAQSAKPPVPGDDDESAPAGMPGELVLKGAEKLIEWMDADPSADVRAAARAARFALAEMREHHANGGSF